MLILSFSNCQQFFILQYTGINFKDYRKWIILAVKLLVGINEIQKKQFLEIENILSPVAIT